MVERILGDDPSVAEPALVGLHTARLCFAALELGGLDDLSVLVADGFGGDAVLGEKLTTLAFLASR